jgi:hypothetical protein
VLVDRVVAAVCFGPTFIPDEDGLPAPINQFLQIGSCILDVRAEVVHHRGLLVPGLIGRLALDGTCWGLVENVDDR